MFERFRRGAQAGNVGRHLRIDRFAGTVYAIGDVHGCLRELLALEALIAADRQRQPAPHVLVYLGDYVDRGPESAEVIRHLRGVTDQDTAGSVTHVPLLGNHEVLMMQFIADPWTHWDWLTVGGAETLRSYGIGADDLQDRRRLIGLVHSRVPDADLKFLSTLPLTCRINRCVFVHAGLRVGIAVDAQSEEDLLWRHLDPADPLPESPWVVVHGHSIRPEPAVIGQRISLDTGAFKTGRLSAARIGADGVAFLQAGQTLSR